jgi:hypothetical protein
LFACLLATLAAGRAARGQTPAQGTAQPAVKSPFSVPIYPLSEIKIGQKAVGKTVFLGNKVEEFEVEILGVMRNVQPRKNLIFSRVSGGPLERTGVMAGMSGSPVYIDGKLVGAVSMTFQFIKEPLAGITPIEDMIDSLERTEQPAGGGARASLPAGSPLAGGKEIAVAAAGDGGPRVLLSQVDPAIAPPTPGAARVVWGGADTSLMQVATPLNLSGFTAEAIEHFAPQFKQLGWVPVQGAGGGTGTAEGGAPQASTPPPQPGSMISVQLVRGDMAVAADGTVTHVENGRLYAFGHPFLSAGPVELPFTEASVIAGIPSYANSMKLSTPGRPLGVISQDQASGIGGVLGRAARMVPVELEMISDADRDVQRGGGRRPLPHALPDEPHRVQRHRRARAPGGRRHLRGRAGHRAARAAARAAAELHFHAGQRRGAGSAGRGGAAVGDDGRRRRSARRRAHPPADQNRQRAAGAGSEAGLGQP